MRILIAEAELELVPPEIAGHPAVRKQAKLMGKQPGNTLLDANMHGPAVRQLDEGERRGRPDITHYSLLNLLESPLCKAGGLEVAVHTRHNQLIRVRSDTRLPRGEVRFQGLMAKVLAEGRSDEGDEPLLLIQGVMEPADALAAFAKGEVVRLAEGPEPTTDFLAGDVTLVLGGFPHGDWSAAWQEAAPRTASIWAEPLNAWVVAAECVAAYRLRQ